MSWHLVLLFTLMKSANLTRSWYRPGMKAVRFGETHGGSIEMDVFDCTPAQVTSVFSISLIPIDSKVVFASRSQNLVSIKSEIVINVFWKKIDQTECTIFMSYISLLIFSVSFFIYMHINFYIKRLFVYGHCGYFDHFKWNG